MTASRISRGRFDSADGRMSTTPSTLTRRKALAATGAVGIALLGAGFGRLVTTPTTRPDLRLDLRFDRDPEADPDDSVPESPVSTPTDDGRTTPGVETGDGGGRRTGGGPFSLGGVRTPVVGFPGGTGGSSGDGSATGDAGGAPVDGDAGTPTGESVVVSTPPLAFDGVVPGDGGTVTATLTVADAPAGLWLRSRVEGAENGRTEPETATDDTEAEGELADAVTATLWFDADGDGRPDEDVLYEGSLSGLSALAGGVPVAECLPPGTYPVRLRWSLPTTATNAVQTDGATFGVDFAATACSGANPFA